ncbi:MAG: hypothetical protein HYZ51_01120 [Candidatus Doudnabacteria bacterium]|nr:hypothetical protein [Candidatus Doudnabacteria bacterium]
MLKHLKIFFYLIIAAVIVFLYWFLPKYSFVNKNPGFCVNLTKHLYYCGNDANLDKLFGK